MAAKPREPDKLLKARTRVLTRIQTLLSGANDLYSVTLVGDHIITLSEASPDALWINRADYERLHLVVMRLMIAALELQKELEAFGCLTS